MVNLQRLLALPFDQAVHELGMFGSYERTEAMVYVMCSTQNATDQMKVFLEWGNMCDAPWRWRSIIADLLRRACSEVSVAEVLPPDARSIYDALPDLVSIWRGCEQGRERGLHWTTDKAVAERFAKGQRCVNRLPTIAQAQIPKQHVFAVFACRNEHEIVLDPRRLRRLSIQNPLAPAAQDTPVR